MAYNIIGYKGETIAVISASGTTTLETAGKYCEDDITITFSGGSVTQDSSIYSFRQSAHNANLMRLKKIIGGTVAWNQLVTVGRDQSSTSNGFTFTYNHTTGQLTVVANNPTASAYFGFAWTNLQVGHKYLISCGGMPKRNGFELYYPSYSANQTSNDAYIANISNSSSNLVGLRIYCSMAVANGTYTSYPMVFDLTAMFGSAIADYAYTLESNTAGSGIAWLKSYGFFTKPYYAYDAGGLQSVKTSAHKMVGFNQWDEEWEVGGISATTGENTVDTASIRAKNKFRILPNTVYHLKCSAAVAARYYDANDNYLASYAVAIIANSNFTTPSEAAYMRFQVFAAYGTTYNHDICINLSGERNGEYEPYVECEYALDGTTELRGILKLDANNNLYYDGDEYTTDGAVKRKYEYRTYASGDGSLADAITDGTHTVVKLSTPTTENATPYIELQATFPDGTEEFVDARTVAMPVSQDAEYFINENS